MSNTLSDQFIWIVGRFEFGYLSGLLTLIDFYELRYHNH